MMMLAVMVMMLSMSIVVLGRLIEVHHESSPGKHFVLLIGLPWRHNAGWCPQGKDPGWIICWPSSSTSTIRCRDSSDFPPIPIFHCPPVSIHPRRHKSVKWKVFQLRLWETSFRDCFLLDGDQSVEHFVGLQTLEYFCSSLFFTEL